MMQAYHESQKKRKENLEASKKLYDFVYLMDNDVEQVSVQVDKAAFPVHFVTKIVPLFLIFFDEKIGMLFEEQYTAQLIIIFIVLEFWLTKNYTGRKMLGYRWYFGEDQHGKERLMFECRANPEHIDPSQPKLFWIVSGCYMVFGIMLLAEAILIFPNIVRIEYRQIQLNLLIIGSGAANLFLFWSVSDACEERQASLRRQLGIQYVRKLELGSIRSFW